MISVMSNNDFELDRNSDVAEDEDRKKSRVSEDDVVVGSSDKFTNCGGGKGASVDLIRSEEVRVLHDDVVDSSGIATRGGKEGMSLDSIGSEGIRVSMELENRGAESENLRVSDGDVNGAENRRPEHIGVSEMDWNGIGEIMESRVCRIDNETVTPRVSDNEFSNQNGGTEPLESRFEGDRVDSGEKKHAEMTLRVSDDKIAVRNGKIEHSGSRAGKGHVEVGKPTVSEYDSMLSMFDEFAANERGGVVAVGPSEPLGYGYEIGDMVWGKVKSHPWWPGHIYNEAFASPSVRRTKREGQILVAFFGDSSYGWFDPAEVVPFDPNFAEKSRQTNSRTFMRAVEEAVDEASRRRGLGLACRCRNPYNFRPTNVQGYFAVDVGDYEPGGVYSVTRIRKARESFQPRETLAFVKQLAMAPTSNDHSSIHFIKNKATVFAYRKAVFEEFDETYAQAFGYQPVRPSRRPTEAVAQLVKEPSRAPLSGQLVIAEALGKGKSSTKPNKAKDQAKKDRYLFKRRDEPSELKTHQISQGQASSSAQPVYVEGSLAIASGDYVLQKRAPAVSIKPQIPAKREQTGTIARDGASASSRDGSGKEADTTEEKPAVVKFSTAGPHTNASKVESPASLQEGKIALLEMKESSGSDVAVGPISMGSFGLSGKGVYPGVVNDMPLASDSGEATIGLKDGCQRATASKLVEGLHGLEVQDGCSGAHLLAATDAKVHVEDSGLHTDNGAKKAKVRKRPVGELSSEKSVPVEKKKKRKKELGMERSSDHMKKRKKELGMEMSSDRMQMRAAPGKGGASVGKVAGKAVHVALPPREDFQEDHQKKDYWASTLLLSDSVGTQQMVDIGNVELELPQLLSDLQALALNPFHGVERRSPAIIGQVFLRFRSLVYQKSLASLPPAENESNEGCASRSPGGGVASDSPPIENFRDLQVLKPLKPPVRPDDPTRGGRKRGPSDRQEEMAAKKKKKINDLKSLAAEKKAAQRTAEAQRDGKEKGAPTAAKAVRSESSKKPEPPARRAPDPTMLVMKFPPRGTLPSLSELKARFARFGQLDHSGTRVFWKSSTCRVVYHHKLDAEAAYKFAVGNNLFGNMNVRCHLRELGVPAPESESGKVQREDGSTGTPQSRDYAAEQRPAATLAPQPAQQPVIQLKSCLKKSSGDEVGPVTGGNGGGRGTPRVKFMLGGEESSRGEQLMVGNKNFFNNNASFADGGASSSSSHAMDFNSKNFQKVIPPSPSPSPSPILPLPTGQFPKAPNNLHYNEVAPRSAHNFNSTPTGAPTPIVTNIDIAQPMLSLLTKCSDVVTNVAGLFGYVPYHPL